MELALRQRRQQRWPYGGLGDESNLDFGDIFADPIGTIPATSSGAVDTTTLVTGGGYLGVPMITGGEGVDSTLAADYAALLASGQAGGFDTGSPAWSSSVPSGQLAAAIASGTVVVSKALTPSGAKVCPSGYARPNGPCVTVGGVGVGGQLIAGVPNQTLMIFGLGFLFLMMLGKGGRR